MTREDTVKQRPMPVAPGSKVDFNQLKAPTGYVPGLGRGAAGFCTRSDIGPARPGAAPGADGAGPTPAAADETKNEFDEFMGNDAGALAGTAEYDEDDKEADAVWEKIDDFMDERRREQREKRLKEEIEKYRRDNPKITEQFADLKRKLADVTTLEWEAIPEIGDYTVKKQKKLQSFVPVPDRLLTNAAQGSDTSIDPSSGPGTAFNGLMTPMGGTASTVTDLTAIGEGRATVIELKLDRMADSVSGQTVVDPKGYLTDLKSMKIQSDADISDLKKARNLLKSVVASNPKHAPGWIAMARLEELAGKMQTARQVIQQGCENCARSEDVWLEAARLQTPENAKAVLARGVAQMPDSVKLWMAAARLEQDETARSRVIRKALERIPNSVRLWKAAVELASTDDARILLSRAVECCPQQVDLWLALARLESYDNAKKVLNKARQAIPTDAAVWITAAKLEESQGNEAMVDKIIDRAIKSLASNSVIIKREQWMKEAENAERATPSPYAAVCRAIVRAVVGLGVDDMDRERTWMADAEEGMKRGSVETARAIYSHALATFPGQPSIWRAAAQLEKAHGDRTALDALLRRAVTYCPTAEVLWLMAAKEKWLAGDVTQARRILAEAFSANPDSEQVWLAAVKLEFENSEPERARALLARARDSTHSSTERVWMKSAVVERELGHTDRQRSLLEEGLRRFPAAPKMWLMLGQLEERLGRLDPARSAYMGGLRRCIDSVPLWRSAARLEEGAGNVAKARATLEQGRLKNPKNPELWLAAIRTESRSGNSKAAEALLAKSLQDCPASGILWSEAISMAPRPARKTKIMDALKRNDSDPHIVAAGAQLFWADRKTDKARSWLNRAVTLNPDLGDHWALFLKFELQHGTPDTQKDVVARCAVAEPRHGERWSRIAKDVKCAHQPTDIVLRKVVDDLETPAP